MRLGGQHNGCDNRVQLNCMRFYERPFLTREEILTRFEQSPNECMDSGKASQYGLV